MPSEYYVEVIPLVGESPPYPEDMEFEKIMTWLCPGCDCLVDWEFGCDDPDPELAALCDDCWAERTEKLHHET